MLVPKHAAVSSASDSRAIEIRQVISPGERRDVRRLRELVYVKEQRLAARVEEIEAVFCRFDRYSTYFVAYRGQEPIGSIRVTVDSGIGLPCEGGAALAPLRAAGKALAEIGNWITIPELRARGTGVVLVRNALAFATAQDASHVLADVFVDSRSPEKLRFYRAAGFKPLCDLYYDTRFGGCLASMVLILDLSARREHRSVARAAPAPSCLTGPGAVDSPNQVCCGDRRPK